MVRHNHPGMQRIIVVLARMEGTSDDRGDIRHAEIQRTASLTIKQPIHADERLPRRDGRGEIPSSRQTAMQPERNE